MLPAQRRLLERRGGDVGSGGSEECCKGSDGGGEGPPSPQNGDVAPACPAWKLALSWGLSGEDSEEDPEVLLAAWQARCK
jgi:hypothetical protein